jgi:hypothetical protein
MKSLSRPASLRGKPYLNLRVTSGSVMKCDPTNLSQVLTQEASLGALSEGGNFCMGIIAQYNKPSKERYA